MYNFNDLINFMVEVGRPFRFYVENNERFLDIENLGGVNSYYYTLNLINFNELKVIQCKGDERKEKESTPNEFLLFMKTHYIEEEQFILL